MLSQIIGITIVLFVLIPMGALAGALQYRAQVTEVQRIREEAKAGARS